MEIKLLICDDVPDLREMLSMWFSTQNDMVTVGEASTGVEAVSMTASLSPDVVLMDVNMPEKDGFEALIDIQRDHPATKVIMLTGLDEQHQLAKRAEELGAADFISKGTDLGEVTHRIRLVFAAG